MLTSSPKLKDAIVQLDDSPRQIHGMTATTEPRVAPLVASPRRAATDLDPTAKSARSLVRGRGCAQ